MSNAEENTSVIVFSVPRSGTHLTMTLLNLLGYNEYHPNQNDFFNIPWKGRYVFAGHRAPVKGYVTPFKEVGYKAIFITRDPRDVVTSLYFHYNSFELHVLHRLFLDTPKEEAINYLITGYNKDGLNIPSINMRFNAETDWRDIDNVFSTTYEKLYYDSENEVRKIIGFLELEISDKELENVINKFKNYHIYKKYYRQGESGNWKEHFSEENKKLFKLHAGRILIEEGYEEGLNW